MAGRRLRLPRRADRLAAGRLDAASSRHEQRDDHAAPRPSRPAWRTPQFWLIWGVLCLNVTAGIGVISMASPMLQDVFGAKLLGVESRRRR